MGIGDIFNNNFSPVFRCQFRIRMTKKLRNAASQRKKVWQKIVSRKTTPKNGPKISLKTGPKNVPKNSPIVQESNGLVHISPYIDKGQLIDIDW